MKKRIRKYELADGSIVEQGPMTVGQMNKLFETAGAEIETVAADETGQRLEALLGNRESVFKICRILLRPEGAERLEGNPAWQAGLDTRLTMGLDEATGAKVVLDALEMLSESGIDKLIRRLYTAVKSALARLEPASV